MVVALLARHVTPFAKAIGRDYYVDADAMRLAVTSGESFNAVHFASAEDAHVAELTRGASGRADHTIDQNPFRNPVWMFPAPRRRPARSVADPAIGPIDAPMPQRAFGRAVRESGVVNGRTCTRSAA